MIPLKYKEAKYENVPQEIREKFRKMVVENSRRGLYIHGPVGTGKTHIAYALYSKYDKALPYNKAIFWNVTDLLQEIKNDYDRSAVDKIRPEERIDRSDDFLFLDDIGAERISEFVIDTFYNVINKRYEEMLPIIFTSNLPIKALADRVGDRIASRIVEMCDVVELVGSDKRMDMAQKVQIQL